ncbi:orotate phosphoribosyltransferase [Psittacicella gerlachiana]|uniref:Orotate phosphoribosyltransferase n=1 Tax=Psittacicella gerlachiana TaxID=2028574 RepID=A0A3A1YKY7_9GAMM|nr:orotate phosphoribosyltransferase [Psittacicella gerlachiana]RIY38842.1 orotate phosphoribosyltransferase [Psittacicella gerlachiana]
MSYAQKLLIAKNLLNIQAVALRPQPEDYFTWTSGIRSPIYCDNRLTMSYPLVRKLIAQSMAQLIKEHFPNVQVLAGTATAGIPHAAWVSELLDLPMTYVRDSKKKHGKTNQIEGLLLPQQNVVVIEDLISTGISSLGAVQALREAGVNVLGVVAIFTYGLEKANQAFAQANCPLYTLTSYDHLIEQALKDNLLQESQVAGLKAWRDSL